MSYIAGGSSAQMSSVNPDAHNDTALLHSLKHQALYSKTKVDEEIAILDTESKSVGPKNSDAALYADIGAKVFGLDAAKTGLDILVDRENGNEARPLTGQIVTKKSVDIDSDGSPKTKFEKATDPKLPEKCELTGFSLRSHKQEKLGLIGDDADNLKNVELTDQKIAAVEIAKKLTYGNVLENEKALATIEAALSKQHAQPSAAPAMGLGGPTMSLMNGPKFSTSILSEPLSDIGSTGTV